MALEALDRILRPPLLELLLGHVARVVVLGVPLHAEGLGFDQAGTRPGAGPLDRPLRRLVDRQHVVAVHDLARNAVGRRARGDVLDPHLPRGGRRVGPAVVLGDEDEGHAEDGREVQPLVEVARRGAAVADEGQSHEILPLHPPCQRHARHHGDDGAEHGDRRHEAPLQVAEVGVAVLAAGGAVALGHVLHHDLPRLDAPHQHGAQVADERPHHVLRRQGVGAAHRGRLLAAAGIEAAHHLALAVEVAQPLLHHAVQLHVGVELELALPRQLGLRQLLGRLRRLHLGMKRTPVLAQFRHGIPF